MEDAATSCALLTLLVLFATAASPVATSPEAASAASKLDLLRSGRAAPGSVVTFTAREINAWAAAQLPQYFPRGVHNARLDLGHGSATGTALIDFVQLRQGAGQTTNWFLAKLLEGEHPVRVTTSIQSAHGQAAVYVRRVEISGVAVSGSALDFLVDNFVRVIFPEVRINEPFPLANGIERVEIAPNVARALIKPSASKPAAAPVPPARASRGR
jgi:hypothetical protein